jgi:hypothetical protein
MRDLVKQTVARLRTLDVDPQPGLSEQELADVERSFAFPFGPEHRQLLSMVLPVGGYWIDWRHGPRAYIRGRFYMLIDGIASMFTTTTPGGGTTA